MASAALVRAHVGEVVSRDDRYTNQNEREVGRVASQPRKMDRTKRGIVGLLLPVLNEARRRRIY